MVRLHLVGIFHTRATTEYSHCAFTGKALRFPRMMQAQGYEVIEYSNSVSTAPAPAPPSTVTTPASAAKANPPLRIPMTMTVKVLVVGNLDSIYPQLP